MRIFRSPLGVIVIILAILIVVVLVVVPALLTAKEALVSWWSGSDVQFWWPIVRVPIVIILGLVVIGIIKAAFSEQETPEQEPSPRKQVGRKPIPDKVKMYVWQRDQGRCVECGSKERLEYDHIIPLSRGGSNTDRNLQLLCERCNRRKGASI